MFSKTRVFSYQSFEIVIATAQCIHLALFAPLPLNKVAGRSLCPGKLKLINKRVWNRACDLHQRDRKNFYSRVLNSVTELKLIFTSLLLNGVLSTFINLYKNQQTLINLQVKMHNRTYNKVLTYNIVLTNYCCFKMKKENWRGCL